MPIQNNPSAHVIALGLEDVKEQGDAVLRGGHQLPDAVLVGGVFSGPPRAGDGPIQLGDEASTGSWTENQGRDKNKKFDTDAQRQIENK